MKFDLEEDLENERWKLLALVDRRKGLPEGSEGAIRTDLEITATREHIRTYETQKGYWSRKAVLSGIQRPVTVEVASPVVRRHDRQNVRNPAQAV